MIVIAATGHNPFKAFKGIFNGTGLNWLFPWVTGDDRVTAAFNLQQTLILTTTLILTGFAVSFAFKCGLFNIGGQGQYIVGAFVAAWVGSSFYASMAYGARTIVVLAHRLIAVVLRRGGLGGDRRLPEGDGRGPRGDLDDHAQLDRVSGSRRPSSARAASSRTRSTSPSRSPSDIVASAHLPVFWGDPVLQGLHVGFFIALAAPSSSG